MSIFDELGIFLDQNNKDFFYLIVISFIIVKNKKNMKNTLKLSIAALMIVALGCKKEEAAPAATTTTTTTTPAKTKTDYLTESSWKLKALTVSPAINISGTAITDWFSQLDACDKDDTEKYNTNGSFSVDEGTTKCDPNDPQTTTGTWVFNPDQTILTVTYKGTSTSYNISDLNASTFKGTYTVKENNGSGELNYTYTFTYGK